MGLVQLGCAKNLVDGEVMLGHLERAGCILEADPARAEVLVVNTCGFIDAARRESIDAILEAATFKRTGALRRLVVAGCMVQRYAEELRRELPEIDAFVGLDELHRVAEQVRAEPRTGDLPRGRSAYLYDQDTPRRASTPPWTAFLKIAEGCDHTCTFCAIPSFRGRFRSRRIEDVAAEARRLAAAGVRELNLIAQDSGHFGRDRGRSGELPDLLRALDAVEGLRWIRVHYLYPNTVDERLIETMAATAKVVPYVDLPLQHADGGVLRRMRRGGDADSHARLLERFRAALPDAALRTTFIVGFPGESEAEFATLLRFVRETRFDHVGVFRYSHEEGTAAHALRDDVPDEAKDERRERLMLCQQEIVLEKNRARVGTRAEVLVEGAHEETEHLLVGRTCRQAPEVDGQVLLNEGRAAAGEFVEVELTDTAGYDLVGAVRGREA